MEVHELRPKTFDHQRVASRIRDMLAGRGLSQAEVARQADTSGSTLSEYLAGHYRGDREEVARKLTAWADGLEASEVAAKAIERIKVYAATPTSAGILTALGVAKFGKMVSIVGTSGVGKTQTLKHFQRSNTAVWYCQFSKDTKSIYAILAEVAEAVGIVDIPRAPNMIRRAIVARIERTRGVILCDEAQHLPPDGFEAIRTLHDRAGVGIVFAGHPDLADKIAALPQVAGRIAAPLRITCAKPQDADALFASWGLEDKQARDFLRDFASRPTGLRRIAAAFELATVYAVGDGQAANLDHVTRAWSDLEGPALAA